MNHLFKLKKGEKTVGYLKIKGNTYYRQAKGRWSCWRLDFDTAHPFVCKDKNDKDVFMNSPITALCPDMSSERIKGCIVPNQNPLGCLMFKWSDGLYPAPDLKDIELLEEKE